MNKVFKNNSGNYSLNLVIILFGLFIITHCSEEQREFPDIFYTVPSEKELKQSDFVKSVKEIETTNPEIRSALVNLLINLYPETPIIEDSSLAILYWYGKANTVLINGDIQNAWASADTMNKISCGDSTFFYKIYSLLPDTRVDYLFSVDGKEILDPRNKFITPSGYGEHSQIAMPMFIGDSVLLFNKNILYGSLDTLVINTNNLSGGKRNLVVYKPFNYNSSNEFSTMYVNDGYKALGFSSYKNVLDNLIADKKIKPMVVVFIKFEEGDQDYFLNKTDKYISFLCDELVTFIDLKYKTSRHPENRAVSGISAGGNISLLTPIIRPEVFSKGAGQSSTITNELLEQVSNLSSTGKYKNHKFYFDVGIYDLNYGSSNGTSFFDLNQSLAREFNKRINNRFQKLSDGHQWANWRERTDDLLIYFFGN